MNTIKDNRLNIRDITDSAPVSEFRNADQERQSAVCFTIHFTLTLENGETVDTTEGKKPVTFTTGDGNLLPGFEKAMLNQQTGEQVTYRLTPENAFGIRQDENIHTYPLYQFPADLALEEGLVVGFADQQGNEQAGVIRSVGRTSAEIDFNHPLAGKTIIFTVKVLDRKVISNE